ncbi:uncharacterized protein BXZ73DRAFT_97452 [Epithele typhae]|uniref:uncharacterized protein n=1 Tax=Epithele typhae TaxID=378194 RepID=UPI00200842F7|nr:uncharacterized protein BXZ73DRAFT_97452 [Epithele typhae]KAH9943411.1 hypothetical protein BXZ73DRAFT_97452 [Epithele typhae]
MAPKSKSAATNGASKKPSSAAPSGTASPVPPAVSAEPQELASYGSGKPDKAVYDAEQNKIKTEIDAVQAKLNVVRDKLGGGKGGPAQERRNKLRAELDEIRGQQSTGKLARGKLHEQLDAMREATSKRIKDLNAQKLKIPYKTVVEVEDRIRQLEKQVESGSMKLVEEKRALQEISQWKRSRRIVEGFQAEQDTIDAERAAAEELRKQLDDPVAKAASERYDTIKKELDEIKKENDEAYASRSKLLDERTAFQTQLDELYGRKRDSAARFKDANDRFYTKLTEDRARRAERLRTQREEQEAAKKKEIVDRIRDEADTPAFQAQIEDCQTLVDYFSGKSTASTLSTQKPLIERADVAGVAKLDIRKVEAKPDGVVVRKKKGEDEESYFIGAGKKKGGKKGGAKPAPSPAPAPAADAEAEVAAPTAGGQLNVPLPILTALLSLSIPPPTSTTDVPRVIEDLKTKKAWFEANQTRQTAENKAKAEAEIRKLLGSKAVDADVPPSDGAEHPPEPAPTPAAADAPAVAVPAESVAENLEAVAEQEAEA